MASMTDSYFMALYAHLFPSKKRIITRGYCSDLGWPTEEETPVKLLIASDLHGAAPVRALVDRIEAKRPTASSCWATCCT